MESAKAAPVTCQVCGEERPGEPLVGCTSCGTLHHLECWLYVGRCSTFGCGSGDAEGNPEELRARNLSPENLRERIREGTRDGTPATCGYCRQPPRKAEPLVHCSGCGDAYHAECWEPNRGCKRFDCRSKHAQLPPEQAPPPPSPPERLHGFLQRTRELDEGLKNPSRPASSWKLVAGLILLGIMLTVQVYQAHARRQREEAMRAWMQEISRELRPTP